MTIRSTYNATEKTIASSGMLSQAIELGFGDILGNTTDVTVEYSETTLPVAYAGSPIPSDKHWDGTR